MVRVSPTDDDYERWAETLLGLYTIDDYDSFVKGFKDYFSEYPHIKTTKKKIERTYRIARKLKPELPPQYTRKQLWRKKRALRYRLFGTVKGKQVRIRRFYVTINKKRILKYRDRKGRFAKRR